MAGIEEISMLWRTWVAAFQRPNLQQSMLARWPNDSNVTDRISFGYPPVFQPGFVGTHYGKPPRVVFLGYNPGKGASDEAIVEDEVLSRRLCAFADGKLLFSEYNSFLAGHVFHWNIYRDMGIFREHGDRTLKLLPTEFRPSVHTVALLNAFPFKTRDNKRPLRNSAISVALWNEFTLPTLKLLQPDIIVHYPDSAILTPSLQQVATRVVQVWCPSYNAKARPRALEAEWKKLSEVLGRSSG